MTVVIGSSDEPPVRDVDETPADQIAVNQNGKHVRRDGEDSTIAENEENMEDPVFPQDSLETLEEMVNRPRWVVPVLPNGELEVLLKITLRLAINGKDEESELCKRFVKEGLVTSFTKILTDDAVSGWKYEIHKCIYHNCELLIELCVVKLETDCQSLLDLLALAFNPDNKFHQYNASRAMDSQETVYAKSVDSRSPKGWLVNLLNQFGNRGGFALLLKRFEDAEAGTALPLGTIISLVKPFGQCCQLLTKQTLKKYLMPIVELVPTYLQKMSDEQLKKDSKNDSLSLLVKWLRYIAACAGQSYTVETLEDFRLQMLLKLLQISSFNGKMNALNEVNKALTNVMLHRQGHSTQRNDIIEAQEHLTSPMMVEWIKENNVISIVLRDSLHQPQYVDKLEKILRFMIKEKALSFEDLNAIWESQSGPTRHQAIVKNIHDLLAKLAWDFSPEQLEHVFEFCFKKSWATASTKKEREKLIELIRRLAEDDKDGMMAHKVLQLLWNLAHNQEVPNEIVDMALAAHLKILDFSCCQDRSAQKQLWIEECVKELKTNDKWVLPALKHISEICSLYQESLSQTQHGIQRSSAQGHTRSDIIASLQNKHTLVVMVTTNLVRYVEESKKYVHSHPDSSVAREGHRYSHDVNVNDRLRFLSFLLRDGQLWLCAPQATQVWKCLAENGAYPSDREACFIWFAKLMGDEPDLDPEINRQFFESNVLEFNPAHLTESGIYCLQRFFKMVNAREGKLIMMKNNLSQSSANCEANGGEMVYTESGNLIGYDYLWRVVLLAPDSVSAKAADILRTTTTQFNPKIQDHRRSMHQEFVNHCLSRIKTAYTTLRSLPATSRAEHDEEVKKITRLINLLRQYVQQCDEELTERTFLPLCRAIRGREIIVSVQLCMNSSTEHRTVSSHTHDSLFSLKRQLETKFEKGKLELFFGEESLSDKLGQFMGDLFSTPKVSLKAKAIAGSNIHMSDQTVALQSSPASTSSSESESPSPPQLSQSSQILIENALPGVLISRSEPNVRFFLTICDIPELYEVTWKLLQRIPPCLEVIQKVQQLAASDVGVLGAFLQDLSSPPELQYYLEVLYCLLLPATNPSSTETLRFQCLCVKSGALHSLVANLLESSHPSLDSQLVLLRLHRFLLSVLIADGDYGKENKLKAESHEDSVVCSISERIVNEMRQLNQPILPLDNDIVETILWNLVEKSWEITNSDLNDTGVLIYEESLLTLTASLRLLNDARCNSDVLTKSDYVFYLLLKCPNVAVRVAAVVAFYKIGMQFDPLALADSLYTQVNDEVVKHFEQCAEYFSLIGWLFSSMLKYDGAKRLFEQELQWLHASKSNKSPPQLIRGHLIVAINICNFLSVDEKAAHRAFVSELLEDFVFPASKIYVELRNPETRAKVENGDRESETTPKPPTGSGDSLIDSFQSMSLNSASDSNTPGSTLTKEMMTSALDLVVELCDGCFVNLHEAHRILNYLFYSDSETSRITEWEYLPAVGPRPLNGFVGLKNAGATCYMNSVLQQLYMITPIRRGLLSLRDVVRDVDLVASESDDYNVNVLKQVMIIFGFLEKSRQQFYVPQGFWNEFRLWGEPINVREQHDALEFFNCLVDSIDEALKSMDKPTILNKVLGGTFADQKICKGCPHRYSCEESFTTLNIDIRNHSNLLDSLEQYVKGDLLEGPNAYHCEQCNKKVDTVKRLCIKSLPPILAIQLKRFDYDWDRECAIKFNDYFEFPLELDMEPYTVQGLARREGELIENEKASDEQMTTLYELSGIVVHSGQASGGHYCSFIKTDGKWYKFDDGEVCESKMDTHDEMKNQCFGGDYTSDYYDQISKKLLSRRQKRWWNAYILFYHRVDIGSTQDNADGNIGRLEATVRSTSELKLPSAIETSVWQQNLQYTHIHDQFTPEFFRFLKNLVSVNKKRMDSIDAVAKQDSVAGVEDEHDDLQNLACLSVELARKFLFTTFLHTKKCLRGNMSDWLNTLIVYLRSSRKARSCFAKSVTFRTIRTYLLESTVDEVRHFFAHLLSTLCHSLLTDSAADQAATNPLAQQMLADVMQLLNKDIGDYGRHVNHYFLFFFLYADSGNKEKLHLLENEVPQAFMRLAVDDGAIKCQYAELGKMYQTLALLLHSLDVSPHQNIGPQAKTQLNPYAKTVLSPMPNTIVDAVMKQNTLLKKLIEESNGMEEIISLLKYLCWENSAVSQMVIVELLCFTTYSCTYEIRPYLDILLQILLIEDSWQKKRINYALRGLQSDREGLLDIIERSKNHYQKRAYQCIKLMYELFHKEPETISSNVEFRQKFREFIDWTRKELERKHYTNQPWSQVSNETSNGYFLERSASAVDLVNRASHLLAQYAEDDESNTELSDEVETVANDERGGGGGGIIDEIQQGTFGLSQTNEKF